MVRERMQHLCGHPQAISQTNCQDLGQRGAPDAHGGFFNFPLLGSQEVASTREKRSHTPTCSSQEPFFAPQNIRVKRVYHPFQNHYTHNMNIIEILGVCGYKLHYSYSFLVLEAECSYRQKITLRVMISKEQ